MAFLDTDGGDTSGLDFMTSAGAFESGLEGDSISSQSITSTTTFNAIGYINALNALSNNLFPNELSENVAVGGGTLTSMNTDKATDDGIFGINKGLVFFLAGANDVGVASPDLATMKSDFTAIKDYTITTLGKSMVASTILPRTQDAGVALTSTQLTALKAFNSWLLGLHDPANGLIVCDLYDGMTSSADTPDADYFKDESGKLLHPNVAGSIQMARLIWARLQTLGFKARSVPAQNIWNFGDMSGTGGTLSLNAAGVVSDGYTLLGYGNNGEDRTGSVDADGQRIVFNGIAGGSGSASVILLPSAEILKSGGTYADGDRIYAWAEVTINDAANCDGAWLILNQTGGSDMVGFNKAGSSTGFMPSDAGRLFMVTPAVTVTSGVTGISPEINCQAYTPTENATVDFTVHRMGISKV